MDVSELFPGVSFSHQPHGCVLLLKTHEPLFGVGKGWGKNRRLPHDVDDASKKEECFSGLGGSDHGASSWSSVYLVGVLGFRLFGPVQVLVGRLGLGT